MFSSFGLYNLSIVHLSPSGLYSTFTNLYEMQFHLLFSCHLSLLQYMQNQHLLWCVRFFTKYRKFSSNSMRLLSLCFVSVGISACSFQILWSVPLHYDYPSYVAIFICFVIFQLSSFTCFVNPHQNLFASCVPWNPLAFYFRYLCHVGICCLSSIFVYSLRVVFSPSTASVYLIFTGFPLVFLVFFVFLFLI